MLSPLANVCRVLFYFGGFAPVGGIETFAAGLLSHLAQQGQRATCLCWGPYGELLRSMEEAGVRVLRHGFRWGCRFAWPDELLLRAGLREIRNADVAFFGKLFSAKVHKALATVRGRTGRPLFVYVTPYRPAEMWRDACPDPSVLQSFDLIVVQAKAFETDLRGNGYEGKVRVIPYVAPAETPVCEFRPTGQVIRIGFLGRLAPQKNLAYLLDAFAELLSTTDGAQYELHIFGDGPMRPSLEAHADQRDMSRRVSFHGEVSRADVPRVIDSCHVFAFSSITEGQPLAALEILARGRPIVATPVGAFPDMLDSETLGAVAPLRSPVLFAEALRGTALRIRSGHISPEAVREEYDQRFSRRATLTKYMNLIGELVWGRCG